MGDKLKIKLNIAGKPYEMNINRDTEEMYRHAEKEINRVVASLEAKYHCDQVGYLALAALQIELNNLEMASSRSLGKDLDELVEIDRTLGDYLNRI